MTAQQLIKPIICFCIGTLLSESSVSAQVRDGQIRMYGIALPKQQVSLRSSIESHVAKLRVREGQIVKRGDVLVELDCREALAKMRVAELEANATGMLNNARAELEFAQLNLNRVAKLVEENALPAGEYDDAKLRMQRAQAALEIEQESLLARKARYELADAELQKYYLRAPFDGQVIEIRANLGQSISLSDEILRLVSLDEFRVELFVPVSQSKQLKVGRQYRLQVGVDPDRYDRIVEGTVVYRSPIIEAATGTFRMVFEIDNRLLKLPAGVSVSLAGDNIQSQSAFYESDAASR